MLRLKELRKSNKLTQQELADRLGVTQATFSGWETEKFEIDNASLIECAHIFNVSIDYLLGRTDERTFVDSNVKPTHIGNPNGILRIPVYGNIPAGIPMEAIEDILGFEEAPSDWALGGKEFFALKIKGDSMSPEYRDGDIIIFLRQPDCENNDDCAVAINGNDWTFKRVEKTENGVFIKPLNPNYETKFFTNQECIDLPVEVKGVIWELRRPRH